MAAQSILEGTAVIVLFGPTGSGKTTFANAASGSYMKVGHGIRSCTRNVNPTHLFAVDDKPVTVIDCPGFDDTFLSDAEILKELTGFLTAACSRDFKITGLIYMHKITDTRVGGTSFRHMNMFKKLCGTESLKNVVYATNMWSQPPTTGEIQRETELREADEFFGGPIADGAQMARHMNTRESAHDIIRLVLDRNPTVPKIVEELDSGIELDQTEAGRTLGNDLRDEMRRLREQMEELRKDYERRTHENDERWRERLKEEERKGNERYQKMQEEMASLKQGHEKAEERWNQTIGNAQAEAQRTIDHLTSQHTQATSTLLNGFLQEMAEQRRREEERLDKMTKELDDARNKKDDGWCSIM